MHSSTPIVVHLVHGTWPFGPFRQKSKKVKAWFEEGSEVRASIIGAANTVVEVREFRWSGRNSVSARRDAARDLVSHLEASLLERLDTKHIIIAHSHGGTVAADALSMVDIHEACVPRIKALICLATPFAYVGWRSNEERSSYQSAVSAVITALILIAFLYFWRAPLPLHGFWIPWVCMCVGIIIKILMLEFFVPPFLFDGYNGKPIDPKIPIFLIRATRDEAALLLGITQTIDRITNFIHMQWDAIGSNLRLPLSGTLFLLFISPITYWTTELILRRSEIQYDQWQFLGISIAISGGFFGLILLMGNVISALSVGLPLSCWSKYFIEVDAAPPNTECIFKAYSDTGEKTLAMRHGIYQFTEVQVEVGRLIGKFANGAKIGSFENKKWEGQDNADDRSVKNQIPLGYEKYFCWVENIPDRLLEFIHDQINPK